MCESREHRGDGAHAPCEAIGRLEGVRGRAAGRIRGWQSYTRGSAERGAMPLTCRGPCVPLCGDLALRRWPGTSPSLCEGPVLVAFLPGGDRGRAGWRVRLSAGRTCSANSNVGKGRVELRKRIPTGHAAPLMETRGHLAAHVCPKKG